VTNDQSLQQRICRRRRRRRLRRRGGKKIITKKQIKRGLKLKDGRRRWRCVQAEKKIYKVYDYLLHRGHIYICVMFYYHRVLLQVYTYTAAI